MAKQEANPCVLAVLACVFLLVGMGMLVIASVMCFRETGFVNHAAEVDGVVAALDPVHDNDNGGVTYAPVVKFYAGGRDVVWESNTSSSPASFAVGDTVHVLFDPSDPQHAEIDTIWQRWGGAMICSFVGLVFVMVAAGMAIAAKKAPQPAAAQ